MVSSRKSPSIESAPTGLVAGLRFCLDRHVLPGQHVVVALSGGIDSVSLLHALVILHELAHPAFRLSALHVHHALSPNADQWVEFCRDYCARLDIAFISTHVTVERASKDGLEAAARRARHAVFAAADADWLMLAHHREDQAETLMFNLLRGTGVTGAGAMRELNGRLLRPLLSIGRDTIEAYAREHCLEWIEDESNGDTRYARNYLRRNIFPELTRRFPAATKNLAGAAARFAEAQELLDDLARLDLGPDDADFPVSLKRFGALDEVRARNLLRYLLAVRGVQIPSEIRLREALRQMLTAAEDRHPAIVLGQYRLVRRRGRVYLESVAECADRR